MSRIETKILGGLIFDEEFCRKTATFIEPDYFHDKHEKVIVEEVLQFFAKFNKLPTPDVINIQLSNRRDINDKELQQSVDIVNNLSKPTEAQQWMIESAEQFCKDKAVYNAILNSIKIIDGRDNKLSPNAIPKILQDALSVSFDTHIGHSYIDDAQSRFEFYHRREDKLAFDIDLLNTITAGGLNNKTLNCVLAACVHPETKVKIRIRLKR